ncbi:MAG: hypothetical protein O7D86_01515 [Proteobacteria bacterium]|nr:hypothetical protein [Pseudomonadota bacterium]
MNSTVIKQAPESRLDLVYILDLLSKDGLINQQQRLQSNTTRRAGGMMKAPGRGYC